MKTKQNLKNKYGFTLVELLVVIVIIGMLMAYAIPSYQQQVVKSKRTEAQNKIMEIAAAQEKHMGIFNQYATSITGTLANDNLGLPINFIDSDNYIFTLDSLAADADDATVAAAAAAGYTTIATAITTSTQEKDVFGGIDCRILSINGIGTKNPLDCWQ